MRFVLDPNAGDGGFLIWNEAVMPAIINWLDPVVQHGMRHQIKYVRLIRRKASSPQAQGADKDGNRYYVQLVLEGHTAVSPKHEEAGKDTIGLDIGPSTLAIVPRTGAAALVTFCEELTPDTRKKRRLQRKLDRQRRANNPDNFDEKGRVKSSVICIRLSRLSYLEPEQTLPSVNQPVWEGAGVGGEPRLRAVIEDLQQRAHEGQKLPRSMGLSASRKAARAGARRTDQSCLPPPRLGCSFGGDRKRRVSNRNPRACMAGRSQARTEWHSRSPGKASRTRHTDVRDRCR
jgi:hypothetical protein